MKQVLESENFYQRALEFFKTPAKWEDLKTTLDIILANTTQSQGTVSIDQVEITYDTEGDTVIYTDINKESQ